MQHRVLSSSFDDEYNPYVKATADIANTAVSDQYLFPTLVSHRSFKNRSERLHHADPQGWSVMSADSMMKTLVLSADRIVRLSSVYWCKHKTELGSLRTLSSPQIQCYYCVKLSRQHGGETGAAVMQCSDHHHSLVGLISCDIGAVCSRVSLDHQRCDSMAKILCSSGRRRHSTQYE
jgi:hypothetical protein